MLIALEIDIIEFNAKDMEMDNKWIELYNAAKAVQNDREISDRVWEDGCSLWCLQGTDDTAHTWKVS